MNRRGFLQALFAVPVLAAPLLVPKCLYDEVYVGPGQAPTLALAMEMVKPGGTVYVLPGHSETVTVPVVVDKDGVTLAGLRSHPLTWSSYG